MASSSSLVKHSNQVSSHGRSTAQMFLKKIIDIISSRSFVRPCGISKELPLNTQFHDGLQHELHGSTEKNRALYSTKRGFDIDLNLRLGPPPEAIESEISTDNRGYSACSAVGEAVDGKACGIIVDCNSSAVSGDVSTVGKSSEGECDPKEAGNSSGAFPATEVNRDEHEERETSEEETREFSEITNLQARSSEIGSKQIIEETEDVEQSEIKAGGNEDEQEVQVQKQERREEKVKDEEQEDEDIEERRLSWRREYKSEGYLGLLVEAAKLISGNFEDDEPEPEKAIGNGRLRHEAATESRSREEGEMDMNESIGCGSKRNSYWMLDFYEGFEDISPVVRSKRGRNQVLPYRYRDSVLEPWKRLSRQRSARVSTKPKGR